VHGWLRLGHWLGPVTRLGWLGPAQPHGVAGSNPATRAGLGPARKKILQKSFQKYVIFRKYFTVF